MRTFVITVILSVFFCSPAFAGVTTQGVTWECPKGCKQIGITPIYNAGDGGVFEFWCEDEHQKKQGPYRKWMAKGSDPQLLGKGQFKDDLPDGVWVNYQDDGTGDESRRYEKGVLRLWIIFDERGKEATMKVYDDKGRADGQEMHRGKVVCNWVHGKKRGVCVEGDQTFTYDENGQANGPCTVFCYVDPDEGGEICKGSCLNGKLDGIADVYFGDPAEGHNSVVRGPFKAGEMDGCNWDIPLVGRGCMKEGHQDGEWKYCDEHGRCTITVYEEGEAIETREVHSPAPPFPSN